MRYGRNALSALLDELIAERKAKAIEYEAYLARIANLAEQVAAGHTDDTPEAIKRSPGIRALYNNLHRERGTPSIAEGAGSYRAVDEAALQLAMQIDERIKTNRPDSWRDIPAREAMIKQALYGILQDKAEVERIFVIIKAQTSEY